MKHDHKILFETYSRQGITQNCIPVNDEKKAMFSERFQSFSQPLIEFESTKEENHEILHKEALIKQLTNKESSLSSEVLILMFLKLIDRTSASLKEVTTVSTDLLFLLR